MPAHYLVLKNQVLWARIFTYEALKKNNWSRTLTAAQMGIHPTTLWRKIKRFELNIPKQNGRTKT